MATSSTMPPSEAALPDKPLIEYDVHEVSSAIQTKQKKEGPANQKFIDGDHWQGGAGWIGPYPTDAASAPLRAEIERSFISRNVILEVTERHSTGVVGREPDWGYVPIRDMDEVDKPTDEEQTLIDEAEALMTTWWDVRNIHTLIKEAVERSLHQGRAVFRIFVPKGRMAKGTAKDDNGNEIEIEVARAPTIQDALDMIYIDLPHPRDAAILNDPNTMQEVGMYRFDSGNQQYADLFYVDNEKRTILKRIGGAKSTADIYPIDIGGRLLMHQLSRRLLITTQVQQQQRGLNLAESMVPRNVITTGFLERIIFNAMLPGHFEDDEEEPTGKRFVPDPYYAGAGTTNFLNGVKTIGRDGEEQVANPTAVFREPIPPKASIEASSAHYRSILNEVDQLHHLISGDAISSAVSRVEARLDFTKSLSTSLTPTEAAGRWLLETVLALAEVISDSVGLYTSQLKGHFVCRLQAGHMTPEEQTALMERVEKNLTTREEAMHLLGVDNVDVAIAKINAQPGSMLNLSKLQAEVVGAWVQAGVILEVAAQLAGFKKDTPEYALILEAAQEAQKRAEEQAELERERNVPTGGNNGNG